MGFVDPVSWRNSKWRMLAPAIRKGRRKWKAKNRVKVALSTENPPQIHWTSTFPMYGIAERRLVITVAPQKDICPQGRTYPTNAVAMTRNKRMIPIFHVSL